MAIVYCTAPGLWLSVGEKQENQRRQEDRNEISEKRLSRTGGPAPQSQDQHRQECVKYQDMVYTVSHDILYTPESGRGFDFAFQGKVLT